MTAISYYLRFANIPGIFRIQAKGYLDPAKHLIWSVFAKTVIV